MDDETETVDDHVQNNLAPINEENPEDEDEFDEDEFSDEEEGGGETWLDVKDLKKMSLDELKTLRNSCANKDGIPRLDQQITKVIVRRLPPLMSVDGYLKELSEIPNYNYIRHLPPNDDLPSGIEKRGSIYINFESEQEAFWFKEKYNNTEFFDDKGNSYIACVDFSFFQGVTLTPPPEDPKRGTLEESDIYKDFVKAYNEDPSAFTMSHADVIATPDVMLDEILNRKVIDPENTPLLQFLHNRTQKKEAAKQDREQKRKERESARKKLKEEAKRKQKEKEEAAKRKHKEKEKDKGESSKRKANEDGRDNEVQRDKRRERDRERQRERDRQRRLRKEKAAAEKHEKEKESTVRSTEKGGGMDKASNSDAKGGTNFRGKEEKEKSKSFGTITYSKSGNPTRWSENSGPRKNDKTPKDDHKKSQEELKATASESSKSSSTSEKLLVEKEKSSSENQASCSKDTQKSVFGKPFPTKDPIPPKSSEDSKEKKPVCTEDKATSEGTKKEITSKQDRDGPKKKVVKKIIKVKKVVKEKEATGGGDDAAPKAQQDGSDIKPKKIVRVVRKTYKTDEGNEAASSKPSSVIIKKKEGDINGGSGDASTSSAPKGESEKEWKNRKGRPEIQIYRPGSLRGGASKSSTSTSASKDRGSSDNVSQAAQSSNQEV